ncbi:hypothetical protein [Synechococcus sp. BIOS-E4-1]|uniref:hypothetical protein n=1 Tax=Synechococcus sp. BIOS-E4-1 TaxID=1400864 RepID=UPI0021070123|nr:hypothetical protein [Synechococcus sp. BIOS-E4-1]
MTLLRPARADWRSRWPHSLLLIGALLLTIQACRNAKSPQAVSADAQVKASSCLEDLNLQRLDKALDHCNAVVVSHPGNPVPLTDRSLIQTLMGRDEEACADVSQALSLLKDQNKSRDPLLEHELDVRQQSCKQRDTMAGNG